MFRIGNQRFKEKLRVVSDIDYNLILGMQFLLKHRAVIDCDVLEIRIGRNLRIPMNPE